MQLAPIQQFPLHGFSRLQPNGRSQGQGKADVKARRFALRTHGLDFDRISGLHFLLRLLIFMA
jgi:hypothetical protein